MPNISRPNSQFHASKFHASQIMNKTILDRTPNILVIEPDRSLAEYVRLDLKESGFHSVLAYDGQTGWQLWNETQPELIVVERILGQESGLQFCSELRKIGNYVPVVMLMARDTLEDRVACLEAGADDYLLKPYSSDEFLNMVRLYLEPEPTNIEKLQFGDLVLELSIRRASRNGRAIPLTFKEYELLKYLMENTRQVLSRERILENVWGADFRGESNVIEVYIRYLRLKLEENEEKRLIQTVRGVGYVLREP